MKLFCWAPPRKMSICCCAIATAAWLRRQRMPRHPVRNRHSHEFFGNRFTDRPDERHRDGYGHGDFHSPDSALAWPADPGHVVFVYAHRHRPVIFAPGAGNPAITVEPDHYRVIAISFLSRHVAGLDQDRG